MAAPGTRVAIKELGQEWVVHATTGQPIAPRTTIEHDEDGHDRLVHRRVAPGEKVMMKCRLCRKLISYSHKSLAAFARHCRHHHVYTAADVEEAMERLIEAAANGLEFPWLQWELEHAPPDATVDGMLAFVRRMEHLLETIKHQL